MNKKAITLLCAATVTAMLLAGCNEKGPDEANINTSDSASDTTTTTASAGSTVSDNPYGSIKTIESPAGFTGNVGDVSIESGDTYAVITIKDFGSITVKLFPEAAPEGVQNFIDLANSGYYTNKEIHRVVADFMLQGGSRNGDGRSTDEDPSFNVEYNTNMRHIYGALCYANGGGINGSQFYIVNNKSNSPVTEDSLQSAVDYYESQLEQVEAYIAEATDADEIAYYQDYKSYFSTLASTARSQLRAFKETTDEIAAKYDEVGGYPYLDGGYTVFGQTVDGFDVIDAVSAVEVEPQPNGGDEISHPVEKIFIESVEIFTKE